MNYRQLGHSGLSVSEISLGSWLTYGAYTDDSTALACLHRAYEHGVTFFDTADIYHYGGAEQLIGRFLQQVPRTRVVIGTKAFFPMSDHPLDRGLSRRHLHNSCAASLRRLGTDYIDLYQCHRYDPHTPLAETCYAMQSLIEWGWIRYWGVSQWTAVQITNAVRLCERHGWQPPISNQPIYNLLNRSLEVDVMEVCETEGLGLVVYSPLAQGILSGKYRPGVIPPDSRAANEQATRYFAHKRLNDQTFQYLAHLEAVAADQSCTLAQLALAWCLRKAPVSAVITGASKPEQIDINVRASSLRLDADTLERIEAILDNAPIDQYTGSRIGHGVHQTT